MLLFQPLARAIDLQPGAVDEDMDGAFSWDAIATLPLVRRSPLLARRLSVVWSGTSEIQAHQLQHGYQKALRLAQPQAEYEAQGQGGLNCRSE
jgi:hypothetical protein